MAKYDYDLFVIGAGSGGVRAGRLAALSGAKVAMAEEHRVGGTCVIRGCVPKKFMVYASEFSNQIQVAGGYGWDVGEAQFDWKRFLEAKDREIARLSGIYVTNLSNAGAEIVHAKARLKDAHTIELVGKGEVTADKILVATGGRPWKPTEFAGAEHIITSEEAFHLPELPKRIMIAGGGYIAVEFAGIFAGLGVDTTLVYRGPNILRGFDDDIRSHVTEEMKKRGVKVMLGCQHQSIEKTATGYVSHMDGCGDIETDLVMFATGRKPYVEGLGLENAGVALNDAGAIAVDKFSKTNVDNIWAVGDVTDRINLTPVAIREGAAFAQTEFYNNPTTFDHDMVASAVFSQPPVGSVGLSEADARHLHGKVDIYISRFRPMKTTFYGGDERCMIKLVVQAGTEKILGCHVVGPDSPEIIQMAAIALKMGVTKPQWDSTCAVHPTLAEELVTMRDKYVPQGTAA
ncbi:glutathione reductase [Phenylobacterium sp. Root77]|uniref:glutathione-disulfide reductase n=1 Tax=unclassified Phenylobacterium TaxID=2640670 RepID=UPI0006FB1960|nr:MULTISPECIES: glutathione-disulfide reductase [unclassified Phenylobacterium]KQW72048.1 glutathione reductase [Phenylobacterium sp. Root1277]KQW94969.1 glutathione reductase [Phenylobacterium sp. Root1290]KRC44663.1 glutathione reductase [Phenylobacterium sp. Root77]